MNMAYATNITPMKFLRTAKVFAVNVTLLALVGCGGGGGGDASLADSIGEGCFTDSECPGDLFCSDSSPTDVCTADCNSDSECQARFGTQFNCVNGETQCARRCNSDADCPDSDCEPFTSGVSYCTN